MEWSEDCEGSFRNSRSSAAVCLFLAYADYSKPFKLHTDTCGLALGAVLYQKQDGMDRVITYASRTLSKCEENYPAHKLRVLHTEVGSDREVS